MQPVTKTVPVFKTEQIQIGTTDRTVFVSFDGKEFSNERECLLHEERAIAINNGADQFTVVEDVPNDYIRQIFDAYEVGENRVVKWIATKDADKLEKAQAYLKATTNKFVDLTEFEDGETVYIADWVDNEYYDRPSYYTKAYALYTINKKIDRLTEGLKRTFCG